jgi:hypothetical protein
MGDVHASTEGLSAGLIDISKLKMPDIKLY